MRRVLNSYRVMAVFDEMCFTGLCLMGCVWWAVLSDSSFPWVEGTLFLYKLGVFWCFCFSPHQHFSLLPLLSLLLRCLPPLWLLFPLLLPPLRTSVTSRVYLPGSCYRTTINVLVLFIRLIISPVWVSFLCFVLFLLIDLFLFRLLLWLLILTLCVGIPLLLIMM